MAIGGVMGGADSEIGAATTRMVLESAYFQPASVRRTSKRLGLKTEASTRFERGADIDAAPDRPSRAPPLLEQIGAAARPRGSLIDVVPGPPRPPRTITLRAARIARVLGTRRARRRTCRGSSTALGFKVNERTQGPTDPRTQDLRGP